MGLENPLHLMIVLLVVLLVFGAKRLPDMGRSMGEGVRGFKEAITGQTPSAQQPSITSNVTPTIGNSQPDASTVLNLAGPDGGGTA